MSIAKQIAKHLRDVHFGGNWTTSNYKDHLADVTWEQAVTPVKGFNNILTLVFHTHYYVREVAKVLQGGTLDAKDKYSFEPPAISNQADWEQFLNKVMSDAEAFAQLIEQLPDSRLDEVFIEEKYGTYFRNLNGIIEHLHYHLGQLVFLKKMLTLRA